MATDDIQQKLYDFLREKYRNDSSFSERDLLEVTGWTGTTLPTYLSKQYRGLFKKSGRGDAATYSVTDAFERYPTFDRFKELVTQVRRIADDYKLQRYDSVVIFDFFMPLSNEDSLRRSLDALFFKDTLTDKLQRLQRAGVLTEQFPRNPNEPDVAYLSRVLSWVDATFGGYSVMHVNGRFKVPPLRTAAEAGDWYKEGGRYLVDETTAVVRFIFPCGTPRVLASSFAQAPPEPADQTKVLAEANKIAWFFWRLFVQSIVRVVDGEDEIWLLESGMRSGLYIWSVA